jgi:mRNA interferase RelE/StbE
MSYSVIVPKPVQKQLNQLSEEVRDRILDKILEFVENPRPSGVKKLKGYDNEYRVRVGDYRIRYQIDTMESVSSWFLACRHRKDAYRD